MFQRTVLKELTTWKNSRYRKPLILRGARQVGKTTLIKEFGKGFDNYLYCNLENKRIKEDFESELDLNDKINILFAKAGIRRNDGTTLIFIDEIQNSPKTISLLRYFYELHPEIHVIAAGSLLENIIDMNVSFPVGRVQYIALRPASFREFVGAMGYDNLFIFMDSPEMSRHAHTELSSLFNQYTIVGGMPEIVQRYSEQRDILAMDDIYETLLQAYRDDVEKYVKYGKLQKTVRYILKYGWNAAGETVTMGGFMESPYNAKDIGESFRLLEKAMILELVYPTISTCIPLIPQLRRSPKLIWFDTGLVNYAAGVRKDVIGAKDVLDVWRGRIGEQIVAQELLTMNNKVSQERHFWAKEKKGNAAEIDFVFVKDNKIYPIEVKTGHNAHLRSLHSFMDLSDTDIAIRVWSQPYSVDNAITTIGHKHFRLINVPFYLVGNLDKIIEENENREHK